LETNISPSPSMPISVLFLGPQANKLAGDPTLSPA